MRPPLRMLSKSDRGVFLMTPWRVAKTRYSPWAWAVTGKMAVTFSPAWSCSRFTMAVPLALRPASGMV